MRFEERLIRVGQGEVCGNYRYGDFIRKGPWEYLKHALVSSDHPGCPNCFYGYVRKSAKAIARDLREYWDIHREKQLVWIRVKPWKETVRRQPEAMYQGRREAFEAVEGVEAGYVFQDWLNDAGKLDPGYILVGFAEDVEAIHAPGEWKLIDPEYHSYDSFSAEGRNMFLVNLAAKAIRNMTFIEESSRVNFQKYGSLYGFDYESVLEEQTAKLAAEGKVRVTYPPDEDPIKEAAKVVFGIEPPEEKGVPIWDWDDYVKDTWETIEPRERKLMLAKYKLIIEPESDYCPPGIKQPPPEILKRVGPETAPYEYWELAEEIVVDLEPEVGTVITIVEPPAAA